MTHNPLAAQPNVNNAAAQGDDEDDWDSETEGELSPIRAQPARTPEPAKDLISSPGDDDEAEVFDDWDSDA